MRPEYRELFRKMAKENASRNASAFERIAKHCDSNGKDRHGNSAATYRACAAKLRKAGA